MKLLIVADIREHFESIRGALAEIAAENDAAWRPEDIYTTVRNGEATLMLTDDGQGFVVVQVRGDAYTGKRVLHILVCWHSAGDAQGLYGGAIDRVAATEGCRIVEFDTRRKGFERRGGWSVDRIVYRRSVADG